jgi:pepF/M3 family oligoendopeptidase
MTTTGKIPPAPRWDLDSVFPGGSASLEYKQFRDKTRQELDGVKTMLTALPEKLESRTRAKWSEFILSLQSACDNILFIMSFAHCLTSQNVEDSAAHGIEAEGDVLISEWEKLKTEFESRALKQGESAWKELVETPELKPITFYLNEMRRLAKEKMPVELESLALELAVNGYHAWNRLYDKMAGDLRVEFDDAGEVRQISLGQLATKLSDPDRDVRKRAFAGMTEAWKSRADLAAMALNSLAGFRLSLYKGRKWESPLHEALNVTRISQGTLDAMWRVIARETPRLEPYIEAKKKLLGIDKFSWFDQFAPCGAVEKLYSFDEAGKFIVDNVSGFSTDFAEFVKSALESRWVEGEDRPGKAGGGYCTRFGPVKQGRIFMTYAGSYENLLTLAHELGHLYHGFVLRDRPFFASRYPMTLAETASIFSELLVTDAALSLSNDPQERLMLIEQKLQSPYTFFCDIHCRYLFERSFYRERKNGTVGKDRLNELMIDAQRKAFGGLLDESGYHPLFWASKLHFYLSDQPFYNFPYTFGFLFAGGVYDRAKREGSAFADKYRALLGDTGSMTTEEVAAKHLGVDLTKEEFWIDAVNRSLADVDEFVKLADSLM